MKELETQQPPGDKVSSLHQYLLNNKYSVPADENVFREMLYDRKKADALHKFLISEKVSMPESADDFYDIVKKKDSGQEPIQQSVPFGEDGSPENVAPSPLTSSVPQPSELEQLLNPESVPNDLEQALASAQQPPPVQTDFGSQSIDAIDEQLRQEIKQQEDGDAFKVPEDAIEKAKKRNKSFEAALNIQFEKQFEPDLKKAQNQFETEQKDKINDIQALVDKGSLSVEKANKLLNEWQDKKQDEINESLTKQQGIKYNQFLKENEDFISKWQDIYQAQFDKEAAMPDLSFSPNKKSIGSDKPTSERKLSRDELLANQFESKKDHIKKLIKAEDKAKYASKIKEVSKNLTTKIDEQLKKMPKDISFEDVGVGTPKVKTDEKREILRMAKDILKQVEDTPDQGGFLEGLSSKGLVHSLPFISSVAEFPELSILKKAAEGDIKVGEKMTENELVLTANDLRNKFNQAKENPSSYRWGQILAEMVPYIVEYATTAGAYTTARAATTTALTNAIKASGKGIVKNAVIKPISTLTGIAAQTAVNPQRVIETAMRRMTPQLQLALSEDGEEISKYIARDGEDFKTAFTKAFGVSALELLTERFGQWSNEAAGAMKLSGSWMPNIVLAKWMEKRGITTVVEAQKQARRIGWDGVFQEIWIEEYPNKILQNAVTGDEQWNPDFFNPLSEEFVDMIVPSLILSGGPVAMAAVNKWASKEMPEDEAKAALEALKKAYKRPEQDIKAPEGDLGKKPATDEKPKEQPKATPKAGGPAAGKVEKEEALPVQGVQQEESKEEVSPTEPGGERFEELRYELETATGEKYTDADVQDHVDSAGGWDAEEGVLPDSKFKEGKTEVRIAGTEQVVASFEKSEDAVKYALDQKKIAKQKIENPEIDETEITTPEDSADEETVIKRGESTIGAAKAVTNEEEADRSLDEIEQTLTATQKKIKGLRDSFDTSDIEHEYPNKVVGKEAKKEIRKYVGVVSKFTGWEPSKLNDNIAPAGGEVSFSLAIPNTPYEMYAQVKYDPTDMNSYGGYENYKPVEIFYRIENPTEKGQKKYVGKNQLIVLDDTRKGWPGSKKFSGAAKFSPKELSQIFLDEAKSVIQAQKNEPTAKEKPVTPKQEPTPKSGEVIGEESATEQAQPQLETEKRPSLPIEIVNKIPKGLTFHETESLKENIKKEGIKEPIILKYYVKDNALRIQEGHHRIKVANELGIKDIPIQVNVVWGVSIREGNEDIKDQPLFHPPKPIDTKAYSERNYAPSNISIEELGFGEEKPQLTPKRKSDAKFEKAHAELAKLDEMLGLGKKNIVGNEGKQPSKEEIAIQGAKVVGAYMDAGLTKFSEIAKEIYETYGEPTLRKLFDALKGGYGNALATASDEVHATMEADHRKYKVEDILTPNKDENKTRENSDQRGGGPRSGDNRADEAQQKGGTQSGQPEGSQGTDGDTGGDISGLQPDVPGPRDESTRSPHGSDEGRNRPELADADVQHNFVYPENWERNKNKTFSKKQAYQDNIAALEAINSLLDNPELFATNEQKEALARYNGLGPLGEILLSDNQGRDWNETNRKYAEDVKTLKDLLRQIGEKTGTDPLATAESSTRNAYYTSLPIIRAIWDGLSAGGFKGGRILEGSVGSGRFIGGMPPHTQAASKIKGVDMDVVSSLVSKYLYPKASITNSPIQDASLPSNTYDLFISNIPFGNSKVYDPMIDKKGPLWKKSQGKLHTYFFAKAIDTVRPGGYVAILTTSNVLDTPSNQETRDLINMETDFVGAVRLSSVAFQADAGTEVVTDVIILRKKLTPSPSESQISEIITKRVPHNNPSRPEQAIQFNAYFDKNPTHVFGDKWEAGGMYSADKGHTLKGQFDPKDVGEKLKEIVAKSPILERQKEDKEIQKTLQLGENGRMVSGGIVFVKDQGYFKVEDYDQQTEKYTLEEIKKSVMPSVKDMPILKHFVETKNTYFDILSKDTQGLNTSQERSKLKESLNKFVAAIKPSTLASIGGGNRAISRLLVNDPDFFAITALVKDDGSFSDVVEKPISNKLEEFTSTDNPQEAIGHSINTYGRIDLPFIQKVMGAKTEQDAIDLIQDEIFETPDGEVIENTEYLSGNVIEKLNQAKEWAKADKKYNKNVEALEKVIPEPIPKEEIKFQLGSPTIPLKYVQQFLDAVFGSGRVKVRYQKATDDYNVTTDLYGGEYEAVDDEGNRRGIDVVVKAALSKSVPMIYKTIDGKAFPLPKLTQDVRDKVERLQDEFEGLILADEKMGDELAAIHNEVLNGIVTKKNDGSKLTFPGMQVFELGAHQKDAIALMIHKLGGMIDHIVGGGKTLIMGAGAIKLKQLGLVNKPMITTMKSVIPGMMKDIKAAYPAARILSPKETDFSVANRERLFAQIANNEWDLIVITHENLSKIPLPSEFESQYISQEIEQLVAAHQEMNADKSDKWAVKQAKALQNKIDNLKARLKQIQDKGLYASRTDFGVMGIDMLFVDESQQFKNLSFITKLRGVAGLGTAKGSQRAENLKMVTRYLQNMHGGDKGTVFASGTPISNSLVELYNIFQYLRPSMLKKLQISSLDLFIKNFAEITSLMEKNVAGVIKVKQRLNKFVNVPELASLYSEISDIRGVHNLKLERPEIKGGKPEIVLIDQSETVKTITKAIYDASKSGSVRPLNAIGIHPSGDAEKALGLVLTTLGTKASIDPRLVFPGMRADGGKIPIVAARVKKIFDETKSNKGVQLIFADTGTPKRANASIGGRVEDQVIEMFGEDIIEEVEGLKAVFKLKDSEKIKQKLSELLEISIEDAAEIIFNANDVNAFSVYGEIRNQLERLGVPANQIAFIHEAPTKKAKEALFKKVNNGEIRILLGSTGKMGTGVNVQKRVAAMHHVDVGWRPSDLEQRNGRGIRRGNIFKEVEVIYYGTKETIDAYRFGLLATKQAGIDSFRAGANGVREMNFEDGESMTMSEHAAAISGDTRILDLEKLKGKASKLKNRVESAKRANVLRERRVKDAKEYLERRSDQKEIVKEVVDHIKANTKLEEIDEEITGEDGKTKKQTGVEAIFKGEVGEYKTKEYDTSNPEERKEFYIQLSALAGEKIDFLVKQRFGSIYYGERNKIGAIAGLPIYVRKNYGDAIDATIEIGKRTWGTGDFQFSLSIINKTTKATPTSLKVGIRSFIRDIDVDADIAEKGYTQAVNQLKENEAIKEVKAKEEDVAELAELEKKRDALSKELADEAKRDSEGGNDEEAAAPEEPTDPDTPPSGPGSKSLDDVTKKISDIGAGQYKEQSGMAMTTGIPIKVKGKVKVDPTNNNLISHISQQNKTRAQLEDQLREEIKFNNPEAQKRFDESRVWTKQNMDSFFDSTKEAIRGFGRHFKYLSVKLFPREVNILREFETLNKWAKGQAIKVMRGLIEPLTAEQYTIFSNHIILSDLYDSIKRGEDMTDIDGKLSFGLNEAEVEQELENLKEFIKADPIIQRALDARQEYMTVFEQELIDAGLLQENDRKAYYHRRVLEYQNDDFSNNILFGKTIGDKKRDFQKKRTGTKGKDYNTNYIETEYKIISEGLYEIEKHKQLQLLMDPYEKELKKIEADFKKEFDESMKELKDKYGAGSEEVKIRKEARRELKVNYLNEHIPEGYVFWRVSEDNHLFWGKTVTQKVIDNALSAAEESDQSGMSEAMKVVDDLVGSLQMGLMVGGKRHQYMVPKELAQQLEEMAKDKTPPLTLQIVQSVTSFWKAHTLLFPTRILRYNLNNFASDVDRTLQTEPQILKYSKQAYKELFDYYTTGKTTDQLIEAMRGDVIGSGYQVSELADLKKYGWIKLVEKTGDMSVETVMGKAWAKEQSIKYASKPADLYKSYMDAAGRIIEFREAILRYAAYKLAVEKIAAGKTFVWASKPEQVKALDYDKRQKAALLAREVYGDYNNISVTGQELRRALMPFYSWTEINLGTHLQLIKNASNPKAQAEMIAKGLAKGIPIIAIKMALAYARLALFSTIMQAWNYAMFGGDDGEDTPMAKFRRSTIKGLQVIVSYDEETGFIKTLPIQGAFYDWLDYFGIPNAFEDITDLATSEEDITPGKLIDVPIGMAQQTFNRTFQQINPFAKMVLELPAKQKYFPDVSNPIPFRDRMEYLAETFAVKDEYRYLFNNDPKKESYWKRKWNNSLFLREFDTELLAYYGSKKMVREYVGGATGYETGNSPIMKAQSEAAYRYGLAMRYGKEEEASEYLDEYIQAATNTTGLRKITPLSASTLGALMIGSGQNPLKGLNKIEIDDLIKKFEDGDAEVDSDFVKSLSPRKIDIFKDGVRFYQRLTGSKKDDYAMLFVQ